RLAGYEPLRIDWNWGKTWEENQAAGALPDPDLLTASRFGTAALFPFSMLLLYLTGKRLTKTDTLTTCKQVNMLGWAGAVFLATNALILLHTRRAMAEGGLTFTVSLFIASLVFCRKHPWLIAFSAALAFCAKQSTLPLSAVGLLAVLLYTHRPIQWKRLVIQLMLYVAIWVSILWLFNPFLWKYPVQSIQAAITARQILLSEQTQGINQALPEAALNSPGLVSLSLVVNQFVLPPSIAEVGNYLAQTQASAQTYLGNPLHQIFRGLIPGGIILAFSAVGFLYSIKLGLSKMEPDRIFWLLVNIAGILQFTALATTITLPFQRYVIPMIPYSCLWLGICIQQIAVKIFKRIC
ncbi:MAG: hypothetical protein Q7U74_04745, partial [Saprospiraceae bacterium]|nr:hypothetical protein [Saprospiraceae bacterium]